MYKKTDGWVKTIRRKLSPLSLTLIILLSSFFMVISPFVTNTASAATPDDVLNRARAWSILNAVIDERTLVDASISTSDAASCHIFGVLDNIDVYVGSHVTGNNNDLGLGQFSGADWSQLEANVGAASGALASVGIAGGCRGLLEKIGYTFSGGKLVQPGDFGNKLSQRIRDALAPNAFFGANIGDGGPGDALSYAIMIYNLKNVCGWSYRNPYVPGDTAQTPEGSRNREAQNNGATGNSRRSHYHTYTYEESKAGDNTYYKDGGREDSVNVGSKTGFAPSGNNNATLDCSGNAANSFGAKLAELVGHRFADAYAALIGSDAPSDSGAGSNNPSDNKTTCAIAAIGWLVCPVVNFLAQVVDGAYAFVASLLVISPITGQGSTLGIYKAWDIMRNFANVAFVIAFLIIIFSQITSVGINNYGIKKMLPRLVVAAILVNLSFWVCAIAVDLSNIIGGSLKAIFDNVGVQIPLADEGKSGATATPWAQLATTTLAATALLFVQLSALLPMLVVALMAIVAVFLVLALRQALVILLIVISPLAFVAFLLPNTESLFKKWRELFQVLLLMFPIIALLFGASALASKVVIASASGSYAIVIQIMGAGISIIPLVLTPILMKTTSGVLGRFGAIVNNPNKGPFDRMKKGAEGVRDREAGRRQIRALTDNTRLPGQGWNYRRRAKNEAMKAGIDSEAKRAQTDYVAGQSRSDAAFRNRLAGGLSVGANAAPGALDRAMASAIKVQAQIEAEEVTAAQAIIKDANLDQDINNLQTLAMGGTVKYTDKEGNGREMTAAQGSALQTAAIQNQFKIGDVAKTDALVEKSGTMGVEQRQAIADGAGSLAGKVRYYGGGASNAIAQGNIKSKGDLDKLVADSIEGNKYSGEILANTDKDALARISKVAVDPSVDATAVGNLRKEAERVRTDPMIKKPDTRSVERIEAIEYGVPY